MLPASATNASTAARVTAGSVTQSSKRAISCGLVTGGSRRSSVVPGGRSAYSSA